MTRSSRLTCTARPMLDRSLALPKPWSRGTDFAKGAPGGDRADLARPRIVGTRLTGGVAIALLLASKLPDPGSAGPDGGMLWGDGFEIEAMFKLSCGRVRHGRRRSPGFRTSPAQRFERPACLPRRGTHSEDHHVRAPEHAGPPGQAPAASIGVARSQLRYRPVRREAWAGPPPRAGARSFPRFRSLSKGVTRLTGTSGSADKGTGR